MSLPRTVSTVPAERSVTSGMVGAARRIWLRAHAGRSLLRLNDQTLEDIGLSRDEVRKTLVTASLRDLRSLVLPDR